MRAVAGVVVLLIALAVVAWVSVRQMKSVGHGVATAASGVGVVVPQLSGSGNVGDQTRQLEHRVVTDIGKALDQGAARNAEADKP